MLFSDYSMSFFRGLDSYLLLTMGAFCLIGVHVGWGRGLIGIGSVFVGMIAAFWASASRDIVTFVMALTGSYGGVNPEFLVMIAVFVGVQLLMLLWDVISIARIDSQPGYLDRILGIAVGAGRGFLLFVVFLLVNLVGSQHVGDSVPRPPPYRPHLATYPAVKAAGQAILEAAMPLMPAQAASAAKRVKF